MNQQHFQLSHEEDNQALNQAMAIRTKIRAGHFQEPTSGLAPGILQSNVVILPQAYASDFAEFCELNGKPCPLIHKTEVGDPIIPGNRHDIDIRTDVSQYHVFQQGELVEERSDIRDLWREDLVTFILGCSFSFEEALAQEGIPPRNVEKGSNVSMYRTNVPLMSVGPFQGNMVVTMRPFIAKDAIRAIEITSHFPKAHGTPIHFGDPGQIGISDLNTPHYGDRVEVYYGEVPVFWACGVTSQVALEQAKLPFCITHKPGYMLITDILNTDLMV